MKKKKNAIELQDVCINYSIMNNVSIRKTFLHKKVRNEVFEAVKHVTFAVQEGDILGIIGKNGSGKSTLLKSIAGVFSPNVGTIDLKGHSVSLMSLGVGFKEQLSGRENIILSGMLLGFSEKEIQERSQDIIDFAEIGDFIDRPVRTYSSGMYSKLAFSITAMLETDIMLVDEVLSVGDEQFRLKSLNKMKELINDRKRTVIIVSHSISTLKELCNQVMWLHDGEVRKLGNTDEVLKKYSEYMAPAVKKTEEVP
ncbi:MAG: ABC transporter ATP-binding protein [Lachnospiraceae bacterium]|nr:ABC transporter ATP-binding protein [Lachnospiraceae bacterium]